MHKIVPAPLLSAALFALWLLLARSTSAGTLALALAFAIVVPIVTSRLRPRSRVRRPWVVVRFIVMVGYDVIASSLEVAWGVLRWWRTPNSRFVVIPLELRDPVALTALSMVTTVVPGTVWSELAVDRSSLLLHVWDVTEEQAFVARYKRRYEKPLQEIFE
ncbi:MAG: Na+/H+ antiporter subunit E [Kofleriaceae bacterium]